MKLAPVLAVILLVLLSPLGAGAQGGVTLEVDAGYDGYYLRTATAASGPTPVRVRLNNSGPSFRARVELDAQLANGRARHYAELDLPQNAAKVVTLYPTYAGFTPNVEVRVLDGEALVAKKAQGLKPVDADGALYGALSGGENFPDLSSRARGATVAILSPEQLPDRAGALSALSALVVDGADTSGLSEAQRGALAGWVQLGGTLIVAGGADAGRNAAGLAPLMPVTLGGASAATDLSSLAGLAGEGGAPPAGGALARGTPVEGARVLAESPQGPLAVARTLGRGEAVWLAFSPSAEPFRAWAGMAPLLRNLADGAQPGAVGGRLESWSVNQFLQAIAGAQLPSTALVAAFLIVYSLVLGPGLYLYLRRRDRRERAWLLVPAITLVFSLLAYGSSFLIRGTGTVLRTLEVVDAYQASSAQQVTTYANIFSPGRRGYDVAMPAGYSIGAGADAQDFFGGDPAQQGPRQMQYSIQAAGADTVIRDLEVDIYSFRAFTARHIAADGRPGLEATLTGDGTSVQGSVRNTTGEPMEDVWVTFRGGWRQVGSLGPGESKNVSAQAQGDPNQMGGPGMEFDGSGTNPRRQVMQSVQNPQQFGPNGEPISTLDPDEVLVLGWQKTPRHGIRVLNANVEDASERLLVLHAGYALKSGRVEVGLRAAEATGAGGAGPLTLTYRLPEGVSAQTLNFQARGGGGEGGFMQGGFVQEGFAGPVAVATAAPPDLGAGVTPVADAPIFEEAVPIDSSDAVVASSVNKVEILDPATDEYADVTERNNPEFRLAQVPNAGRYVGQDGVVTVRVSGNQDAALQPGAFRLEVVGQKR